MHIAKTLDTAEGWTIDHWNVVEVASREQVAQDDYWYFILTEPSKPTTGSSPDYRARDYQARIMSRERVVAIGRDAEALPVSHRVIP